ncbi:MAG: hypothetical protein NDJ89_16335 [Oligoflexia bacterium]|nr:hypothetical protein [Oligoflexia bacterium]
MIFLWALLMATTASLAEPGRGGDVGNGGDAWVAEFAHYAAEVRNRVAESSDFDELVPWESLASIMRSAKLESTDSVLFDRDGLEREALNFPERELIRFNRARWSALSADRRLVLVLHEYLGLMKFDDGNYEISRLILRAPRGIRQTLATCRTRVLRVEAVGYLGTSRYYVSISTERPEPAALSFISNLRLDNSTELMTFEDRLDPRNSLILKGLSLERKAPGILRISDDRFGASGELHLVCEKGLEKR